MGKVKKSSIVERKRPPKNVNLKMKYHEKSKSVVFPWFLTTKSLRNKHKDMNINIHTPWQGDTFQKVKRIATTLSRKCLVMTNAFLIVSHKMRYPSILIRKVLQRIYGPKVDCTYQYNHAHILQIILAGQESETKGVPAINQDISTFVVVTSKNNVRTVKTITYDDELNTIIYAIPMYRIRRVTKGMRSGKDYYDIKILKNNQGLERKREKKVKKK